MIERPVTKAAVLELLKAREGSGATRVIYQLEHTVRLVDNVGKSVGQLNKTLHHKAEQPAVSGLVTSDYASLQLRHLVKS